MARHLGVFLFLGIQESIFREAVLSLGSWEIFYRTALENILGLGFGKFFIILLYGAFLSFGVWIFFCRQILGIFFVIWHWTGFLSIYIA